MEMNITLTMQEYATDLQLIILLVKLLNTYN